MKLWTSQPAARQGHRRREGEAMAVVKIKLDGGAEITSSITKEAAEDLRPRRGQQGHGALVSRRGRARPGLTLPARRVVPTPPPRRGAWF